MHSFLNRFFGTLTLMLALNAPVSAGDNPVVVELYTSQGCSSCPPADAFLHKLASKDGVIALGLHVDYWDYLGWKDDLADPGYTRRQRAYARVAGNRSVYTPQMVIGGTHHVVGHRIMEVMDYISAEGNAQTGVSVDLQRQGNQVLITADSNQQRKMMVVIVRYRPQVSVDIRRGENAGKTIEYANVVTQWQAVQSWNGAAPLGLTVDASGEEPVVVLIQAVGPGPVLAAARLR